MNKNYKINRFFYLALLFSFKTALFGNSYIAAYISYQYIETNKYKISLHAVMDCNKYSLTQNYEAIQIYSKTKSISVNQKLFLNNTTNLNKPNCRLNCSYKYSLKEYVFEDTIDFSSSSYAAFLNASACDIYLTTISASRQSTTEIYSNLLIVSSFIDLCNHPKNNSPKITNLNQFFAQCGYPYYFQNFTEEIDNDDFTFELQPVLNFGNSPVAYNTGLDYSFPLNIYCPPNIGVNNCKPLPNAKPPRGFFINNKQPELVFTPEDCDQSSVISMRIKEFRNDSNGNPVQIGFMDYQYSVFVISENNIIPSISAPQKINFCSNNLNEFEIQLFDVLNSPLQTSLDGIDYQINNLPKGAKITTLDSTLSKVTLKVSFTPSDTQTTSESKKLEILAFDNNCTSKFLTRKTIEYNIYSTANIQQKISPLQCSKIGFKSTVNNSSVQWQVKKDNQLYYLSKLLADSTLSLKAGKYFVLSKNNLNNGCILHTKDSIDINYSLIPTAYLGKDTFVCYNDSLTLNPNITNGNAPYNYKWNKAPLINKSTYTTKGNNQPLIVVITDNNQCKFSDTINVKPMPEINVFHNYDNKPKCKEDSIDIFYYSNKTSGVYYQWSTPYINTYSSTASSFKLSSDTTVLIKIKAIDSISSCYDQTEFYYKVNTSPVLSKLTNHEKCQGDSISLTADLSSNKIIKTQWELDNVISSKPEFKLINLSKSKTVYLTYTDSDNCVYTDSSIITVYKIINKSYPDINVCNNANVNLFSNGFEQMKQGKWNYPLTKIDSNGNIKLSKNEIIDIEYSSDYNQCYSLQKARVFVNKDSVYATLKALVTVVNDGLYTEFTFPEFAKNGHSTFFEIYYGNGTYFRTRKTSQPHYYTYFPMDKEYAAYMVSSSQKCRDTFFLKQPISIDYLSTNIQHQGDIPSIYPNPTQNTITIEIEFETEYTIADVSGKIIEKGKLQSGKNHIDLKNNGMYFITLITANGNYRYKVIKN